MEHHVPLVLGVCGPQISKQDQKVDLNGIGIDLSSALIKHPKTDNRWWRKWTAIFIPEAAGSCALRLLNHFQLICPAASIAKTKGPESWRRVYSMAVSGGTVGFKTLLRASDRCTI
jgi:hypothetical protein